MRRVARITGTLMIVAGLGALAWAVTVWLWQDPFTAAVHRYEQRELEQRFERHLTEASPELTTPPSASPEELRRAIERRARAWRRGLGEGDAVARLRIPELGVDEIIVNGTDTDTLKRGPGRHLASGVPGEGELVYVAGHRTTYGAPFSHIDRLEKGDRVFMELPYGTFEYRITGHRIVAATELSVLKSRGSEVLALQACHPRFFASQRYIAYAEPVVVVPPERAAEAIPLSPDETG
jgi:sortase A